MLPWTDVVCVRSIVTLTLTLTLTLKEHGQEGYTTFVLVTYELSCNPLANS